MRDGFSIMYGGALLILHATYHLPKEILKHWQKQRSERTRKLYAPEKLREVSSPAKGTEHVILQGLEKRVLLCSSPNQEPEVAGILVSEKENKSGNQTHRWTYTYVPFAEATEEEVHILQQAREQCVPFWDSKLNLGADYR